MQNYSAIQKNEILPQHGWTWRVLCLAQKVRQKDKYCMVSLICEI